MNCQDNQPIAASNAQRRRLRGYRYRHHPVRMRRTCADTAVGSWRNWMFTAPANCISLFQVLRRFTNWANPFPTRVLHTLRLLPDAHKTAAGSRRTTL